MIPHPALAASLNTSASIQRRKRPRATRRMNPHGEIGRLAAAVGKISWGGIVRWMASSARSELVVPYTRISSCQLGLEVVEKSDGGSKQHERREKLSFPFQPAREHVLA